MKTLFVILGSALVLVAGGIVALVVREKSELAAQLASSEARFGKLESEIQSLKAKEKKLLEDLDGANAKLEAAKLAASASSKPSQRGAVAPLAARDIGRPESTKPMKALSDMMKNPAMREMAKQQQIAMLDMQYGDLFKAFNLNDEEKANFKQLLAERLAIDSDMGMKLMDDTLTPEQRKAMLTEVNEQKKLSNERIKTFLNSEEDGKIFDHFENTKAERMQLTMGKGSFAAAPLTPQQELQLIDIMHEANMAPSNVPNLQRPENFDPRKFTQNDIEKQLQKFDANAAAVRAKAQTFMSPEQLKALGEAQAGWRSMQEKSFNMMSSLLGNGAKQ